LHSINVTAAMVINDMSQTSVIDTKQ